MIHEPDAAGTDPLQVPRLQLEGVVDPLRGDRPEFSRRRARSWAVSLRPR